MHTHTIHTHKHTQAMIDVAASEGWLAVTLSIMALVQMCIQGRWVSDNSLLTLPILAEEHIDRLNEACSQSRILVGKGLSEVMCLAELVLATEADEGFVEKALGRSVSRQDLRKVHTCMYNMVHTLTFSLCTLTLRHTH